MNYTRGVTHATQDLRPLPDAKHLGAGPMPPLLVPLVFLMHVGLIVAIGWGGFSYTIYKKTNEQYAARMQAKTEADAKGKQVRDDIEANTRARAFFSEHERLLKDAPPIAPVLSQVLPALPAGQKIVRVSLRRADDAREKGEILLRVELVNEGQISSQTINAFNDELIRRGLSPTNIAARSDARKNYIEGRITPKAAPQAQSGTSSLKQPSQ